MLRPEPTRQLQLERKRERQNRYRQNNLEKHRAREKRYREANREKCRQSCRRSQTKQRMRRIMTLLQKPDDELSRYDWRFLAEHILPEGMRWCWWHQRAHPVEDFPGYQNSRTGTYTLQGSCREGRRECNRITKAKIRRRKENQLEESAS